MEEVGGVLPQCALEVLLELEEAEAKVVRALEIAARICDALAQEGPSRTDDLAEEVGEYVRLIKDAHASVEPKISLLTAYEAPRESSYAADLAARVASSISSAPPS